MLHLPLVVVMADLAEVRRILTGDPAALHAGEGNTVLGPWSARTPSCCSTRTGTCAAAGCCSGCATARRASAGSSLLVQSGVLMVPAAQRDLGPRSPWGRFLCARAEVDAIVHERTAPTMAWTLERLVRHLAVLARTREDVSTSTPRSRRPSGCGPW